VRPWKTIKKWPKWATYIMRPLTLAFFYGCLGFGLNDHSLYMLVWAKTQMTLHLLMVVWAMTQTTMHLFMAVWAKLKYHSFFACFFLPPPYRTFSLNLHLSLHLLLSHIISLLFFFHHLVAHYAHNWLFFQFLRSQNARVAHWSSYTIFFIINWYILLYILYKYIFLYKVGSTFSIQWFTMLTYTIFNASHTPSLLTNIYF